MAAPTFDATRFLRSVSLSIALYLSVIAIASMTLVNPAQASGTVRGGIFASASNCIKIRLSDGMTDNWNYEAFLACVKADVGAESDWINMGGECAACDVYATFPKDSQGYCPKNICFASYHITYSASCPAHAQPIGNPCTCDDPYVPDPTKTSCVLDQYSLSLQISPGQVEPAQSAKIIAKVIDTLTGQPKEGVTVGIQVDVNVTSGGHVHGESVAPRGKGTLIPATGTTLADGTVSFTFGAPEVSGKHSFTAKCDNPTCTNNPVTAEIKVMVDGLSTIPGDPSLYVLIGGEADKKHHDNHYLTDDAMSQLAVLAINYHLASR